MPDLLTWLEGSAALAEFALVEPFALWLVDLEVHLSIGKRKKHRREDGPTWWVTGGRHIVKSQVAEMDLWWGRRGT